MKAYTQLKLHRRRENDFNNLAIELDLFYELATII